MRKTLSLLLALVMAFGTIGTAFATTDASNGTTVSYVGTGNESYTVTVPAHLSPESSGQIEVNGTWPSYRKLVVAAPDTVTLVSDGQVAHERVLAVTFDDIEQVGDDVNAIHLSETISVGAIENALFGKWEGKITYTVYMDEIVRMLDGDGQTINTFAVYDHSFRSSAPMDELQEVKVNGETVDQSNYIVSEGSTIITFNRDYATKLETGNHTIDIVSQSGTASGNFNVVNEIPEGGEYRAADGTVYTAGSTMPSKPQLGDIYAYGNYEYCYGYTLCALCADYDVREWPHLCDSSDHIIVANRTNGWTVGCMNDVAEPGAILGHINGESIVDSLDSAFAYMVNLKVAPAIPYGVTDLAAAFEGCTNLTTAPAIPSSVTSMVYTFDDCTSLTDLSNLVIPSSVTDMDGTFSGCTSLTDLSDLVIPNSVTNMSATFMDCTSLTTAPMIPSSVINMNSTFSGCTNLTTAPVIPSSVTDMGHTFAYCTNLTGTIEINANPNTYNICFWETTQPIVLTGSSTMLDELADTASDDNVTVVE
jgi:hypothetical protein